MHLINGWVSKLGGFKHYDYIRLYVAAREAPTRAGTHYLGTMYVLPTVRYLLPLRVMYLIL